MVPKESLFYSEVIPTLKSFVESSCTDSEIKLRITESFPELFGQFKIGLTSYFVFDDFAASGYQVVTDPPRAALPFEQRLHAVERVSMFQGGMLAMKKLKHPSFSKELLEDLWLSESGFVNDFCEGSFDIHLAIARGLAQATLNGNRIVTEKLPNLKDPGDVLRVVEKLKSQFPNPFRQAYQMEVAEETANLIWGDCHGRNIAMNGDSCIFYDFQLARKWDSLNDYVQLVAAVFSLQEVTKCISRIDDLYHSTLLRTLSSFGISDDPYGSLAGFESARKRLAVIYIPYFSINAYIMDLFVDKLGMVGFHKEMR
eukprot:sb/3467036/